MKVGYKTGTGNVMALEVNTYLLERADVPVDYSQRQTWCGDCKGANGGCPEFSPQFEIFKRSQDHMFIIEVVIDMMWAIVYSHCDERSEIRNNYLRSGYADMLTDKYGTSLLRSCMNEGFYGLGIGHCKGCVGKAYCTVLQDKPCSHPDRRTFSMEASGVDCDQLCQMINGFPLRWWYKSLNLPAEMRRYCGVFCKAGDVGRLENIVQTAMANHKSFIPGIPELGMHAQLLAEVDQTLDVIPQGAIHAGESYPAYCAIGLVK